MHILIFGKGYVAQHFKDFYGEKAEISELRIENLSEITKEIESKEPTVVINAEKQHQRGYSHNEMSLSSYE